MASHVPGCYFCAGLFSVKGRGNTNTKSRRKTSLPLVYSMSLCWRTVPTSLGARTCSKSRMDQTIVGGCPDERCGAGKRQDAQMSAEEREALWGGYEMYHTLKPSIINIHQHYYWWIFIFILEKVRFFFLAYFSSKGLFSHFFLTKFIENTSSFHLHHSYLLLQVKHLRDSTPNTIRLVSGIVGYNSKKVKSAGHLW